MAYSWSRIKLPSGPVPTMAPGHAEASCRVGDRTMSLSRRSPVLLSRRANQTSSMGVSPQSTPTSQVVPSRARYTEKIALSRSGWRKLMAARNVRSASSCFKSPPCANPSKMVRISSNLVPIFGNFGDILLVSVKAGRGSGFTNRESASSLPFTANGLDGGTAS